MSAKEVKFGESRPGRQDARRKHPGGRCKSDVGPQGP